MKHENNESIPAFKSLVKKTMHIKPDQDKALRLMAAIEDKTEYEIIIEALEKHIPTKYYELLKNNR